MGLKTFGSKTFAALTFGAVTLHGLSTVTPPVVPPSTGVTFGGGGGAVFGIPYRKPIADVGDDEFFEIIQMFLLTRN